MEVVGLGSWGPCLVGMESSGTGSDTIGKAGSSPEHPKVEQNGGRNCGITLPMAHYSWTRPPSPASTHSIGLRLSGDGMRMGDVSCH